MWNRTDSEPVAEKSLNGIETSPNEMVPEPMGLGTAALCREERAGIDPKRGLGRCPGPERTL